VRLLALWIALGVAIAVGPAKAQEQKTLGPCSPAVADVSGNVAVTCLTSNQRIRPGRFAGNFFESNRSVEQFTSFLSSNSGEVVYLDMYADNLKIYNQELEELYFAVDVDPCKKSLFATHNWLDDFSTSDLCSFLEKKHQNITKISFKDLDNVDHYIYMLNNNWHFHGYFIVESDGCYDTSKPSALRSRTCEYRFRAIDDEEILLSDKYDTK
jgi:hypothetical protein